MKSFREFHSDKPQNPELNHFGSFYYVRFYKGDEEAAVFKTSDDRRAKQIMKMPLYKAMDMHKSELIKVDGVDYPDGKLVHDRRAALAADVKSSRKHVIKESKEKFEVHLIGVQNDTEVKWVTTVKAQSKQDAFLKAKNKWKRRVPEIKNINKEAIEKAVD